MRPIAGVSDTTQKRHIRVPGGKVIFIELLQSTMPTGITYLSV